MPRSGLAPKEVRLSFQLRCPQCGPRSVYEFRFGGEVKQRPAPNAPEEDWFRYIHVKANCAGDQVEWWFHRSGCRQWLKAERNTVSNEVKRTWLPGEDNE